MSISCSTWATAPRSATRRAPLRAYGPHPCRRAREPCAVQGPRHRAVEPRLHARMARLTSQGQSHLDQGRAARPEADRRARQHLCLRGAVPRQDLAAQIAGTLATKTGKPTAKTEALVAAVKAVLGEAIKAGGSSLRDYRGADGELGRFQHRFKVYGREGKPCPRKGCGGTVRRIVQGGRSTFYCPTCQH